MHQTRESHSQGCAAADGDVAMHKHVDTMIPHILVVVCGGSIHWRIWWGSCCSGSLGGHACRHCMQSNSNTMHIESSTGAYRVKYCAYTVKLPPVKLPPACCMSIAQACACMCILPCRFLTRTLLHTYLQARKLLCVQIQATTAVYAASMGEPTDSTSGLLGWPDATPWPPTCDLPVKDLGLSKKVPR